MYKIISTLSFIITCSQFAVGKDHFTTTHYEAESSTSQAGCSVENRNFPYVGFGYLVINSDQAFVEWNTITVPSAGQYTLIVKYANSSGRNCPCEVKVNTTAVGVLPFKPVYKNIRHYWNDRITVNLKKGTNTIRLTSTTKTEGLHFDNIAVSSGAFSTAPGKIFDVKAYGAKGDGLSDDTKAIQASIDACSSGGSVVLKNGIYMSGTIHLKSDMTFWIDKTSTLRAIQDTSLFPDTDPPTNNMNVTSDLGQSFVHSEGANNLTITGGGTVDGNGECEIWGIKKEEAVRPMPIYLTQGKNIKIMNIDVIRGAMWTIVPLECDDVVIDGININSTYGMNKDGIDPCDCHRVLIANCTLTVEDDALCPKSGSLKGCEDITYRNITVNKTLCGMIKLGTKTYGHFKNIIFEDIALLGYEGHKKTNVGINISTVDGADIENIIVRRVNMERAATAIFIMHGAGKKSRNPAGEPDKPGRFVKNILIEDVDARECHDSFGNFITGMKDKSGKVYKVTNVILKNVKVQCKGGVTKRKQFRTPQEYSGQYPNYNWCRSNLPAWGYYIRHAENIQFINCTETLVREDIRPKIVLKNAKNVTIDSKPSVQ